VLAASVLAVSLVAAAAVMGALGPLSGFAFALAERCQCVMECIMEHPPKPTSPASAVPVSRLRTARIH